MIFRFFNHFLCRSTSRFSKNIYCGKKTPQVPADHHARCPLWKLREHRFSVPDLVSSSPRLPAGTRLPSRLLLVFSKKLRCVKEVSNYVCKFTYIFETKFRSQRCMFCFKRYTWRFMKLAVQLYKRYVNVYLPFWQLIKTIFLIRHLEWSWGDQTQVMYQKQTHFMIKKVAFISKIYRHNRPKVQISKTTSKCKIRDIRAWKHWRAVWISANAKK